MADTASSTAATGLSEPRSRHGARGGPALVLSTLAFVAATVRLLLPSPTTPTPSGLVPRWAAVAVAAVAVVVVVGVVWRWGRSTPRGVLLPATWGACAGLLVVAADGIAFDLVGLLMRTVHAITGDPLVVNMPIDWPGLATRVLALAGAVPVGRTALSYRRRSRGSCIGCGRNGSDDRTAGGSATARAVPWARVLRYAAYPAAALAFGYGTLKAQWGLGGTVGLTDPDAFGDVHLWTPGLGDTAVLAAIGVVLAFALAHPWGRRLPRWLPLTGAVVGCTMLVPVGLMGSYGVLNDLLGAGPVAKEGLAAWVFVSIYPCFLTWGLALGAAAWSYHHRTRGTCARCGR